jgi:hypothetical protein
VLHVFLVVVRGLEEKLFIVTKEKENLEDELQSLQQRVGVKACIHKFMMIV